MKIREVTEALSLSHFTGPTNEDQEVAGAYVSDLLSDVMANCPEGGLWITLQTHVNIVAVASMRKIPAIILINGRKPEEPTLKKAAAEGIALLGTSEHAFEVAGKLYALLRR